MSENRNVFVLGLGAQKCGTTWLHYAISQSGVANMGHMKEYHIWDGKYVAISQHRKIRFRDVAKSPKRSNLIRFGMQEIDGFYERYFKRKLGGPFRITGDITPAYAGLSEVNLRDLRGRLIQAGFNVKVVFLMRDPFERCWSALRMKRRKQGGTSDLESDQMKSIYSSEMYQMRTRYELAVERIEKVFEREEVFFGIYEELFSEKEIQRLSDFLTIEIASELLGERKNFTAKSQDIDHSVKRDVMDFYRETYQFCFDRFPQTRSLWNCFDS